MSLAGCQIIPIDLNFYLQKCLEIFDENSADKIQSKNYKEVNPPCLMPIRVKGGKTDEQVFCLCNFLLENASCFYPIDYTSAFLRLLCNLAPVEQGPTIWVDLIQVKLSSQGLVLTTAVLIEILLEFFLYCKKSRKSSKDVCMIS